MTIITMPLNYHAIRHLRCIGILLMYYELFLNLFSTFLAILLLLITDYVIPRWQQKSFAGLLSSVLFATARMETFQEFEHELNGNMQQRTVYLLLLDLASFH